MLFLTVSVGADGKGLTFELRLRQASGVVRVPDHPASPARRDLLFALAGEDRQPLPGTRVRIENVTIEEADRTRAPSASQARATSVLEASARAGGSNAQRCPASGRGARYEMSTRGWRGQSRCGLVRRVDSVDDGLGEGRWDLFRRDATQMSCNEHGGPSPSARRSSPHSLAFLSGPILPFLEEFTSMFA